MRLQLLLDLLVFCLCAGTHLLQVCKYVCEYEYEYEFVYEYVHKYVYVYVHKYVYVYVSAENILMEKIKKLTVP